MKIISNKSCLYLTVFFTVSTLYPMRVIETRKVVSVSEQAEMLSRCSPEGNFSELVESIDLENTLYKELLKRELIRLRWMEFSQIGSTDITSIDLPPSVTKYCLSPYSDHSLLLYDNGYSILFSNLRTTDQQKTPDELGKPFDAFWISSHEYIIVFEEGIMKYSINWKTSAMVSSGKSYANFLSIKAVGPTCRHFIGEKEVDGKVVICSGEIGHNVLECEELSIISFHGENTQGITSYSLSADGNTVACCNGSNNVYILERPFGKVEKLISPKAIKAPEDISLVACDLLGEKIAMASSSKVYIAHTYSRSILKTISLDGASISSLAFSPCSRYVIIGLENGKAVVFDLDLQRRFVFSTPYMAQVRSCTLQPTWNCLCITKDKKVEILKFGTLLEKLSDWKQVLLVLKASQYSFENVKEHPYFRNALTEMQQLAGEKQSPFQEVMAYLEKECEQCQLCMNYRSDTKTKCNHVFCKNCLVKAIQNSPTCPFCRGAIDMFFAPEGIYKVNYKVSLEQI